MQTFIKKIIDLRKNQTGQLPGLTEAKKLVESTLALLLPQLSTEGSSKISAVENELYVIREQLEKILYPLRAKLPNSASNIIEQFMQQLPQIQASISLDAQAIYNGDPAATSVDEVIVAYPGFLAIAVYRIAHEFYLLKLPIVPRLLTEYAHQLTGIDIHPGATIGKYFCIDHGTGIVIGETTVIKDNVKIYQGVTLGGLSVEKSMAGNKRHPTIEDNVVIYANATILGGETIIGKNSIVGGNVWLTASIAENSMVYHKSEVKVKSI